MYAGCKKVALEAADELEAFLSHEVMTSSPLTPVYFEAYLTTRLMALIRFGMWDEILQHPFREDRQVIKPLGRGVAINGRELSYLKRL